MEHRHLNHQEFSLAAIDDIILRGKWSDWADLRRAMIADNSLLEKIKRICEAYSADAFAQRHHFWMKYAKKQSKTS
jgi:hypothetical protein